MHCTCEIHRADADVEPELPSRFWKVCGLMFDPMRTAYPVAAMGLRAVRSMPLRCGQSVDRDQKEKLVESAC